jgi:hypothetical protein
LVRFLVLLASLYFFICSLSFLSTGFRVAGGRNIGGKEEYSGKQLGLSSE